MDNAYSSIFHGSYDGLVLCDSNGVLLNLNEGYRRITGASVQDVREALGRPMAELVQEGVVAPSVTLEVLRRKQAVTLLQRIKTGRIVLATGNPLYDEIGRIKYVVTNVRSNSWPGVLDSGFGVRQGKKLEYIWSAGQGLPVLVASSPAMGKVLELARRVAASSLPVIICGESGTGKDVLARFIHACSLVADGPFVPVNCAAVQENLLEAELFGYEPGAFTGASKRGKEGLVEVAHGGTLFLDEIAEIPVRMQAKLLRFLQDGEFYRVGGNRPRHVQVRLICATNQNLSELINKGLFRSDLYYRMAGVTLNLPALRERREDIWLLAGHFIRQVGLKYGREKVFDPQVRPLLEAYAWPGNVRELQNTVERVYVLAAGEIIDPDDVQELLDVLPPPADLTGSAAGDMVGDFKKLQEQFEKELFQKAMRQYGSIRGTARALGLAPATVIRKLRKYKI
ncbi:sigma-54 interaction domain-containing protein [Desulfurispora thermophila]|uniref:sigma-54 interaction domain-containing protein n=1 Tax=Desulfurispora thermophila TaxID=265470 RepID=UPI00037FDCB6|nr:sigma 54-interacting transcriptional regulator [Desulfurispora thermophila]